MARFDVYSLSGSVPYVIDVQAELFSTLNTRIVVPLRPVPSSSAPTLLSRLNPEFTIEGGAYYMSTPELSAISVGRFGPRITNFEHQRQDIIDALDFLLQGF